LAEPVKLENASVRLNGAKVDVRRWRGRIGKLTLAGDYRFEPDATRPHKFNVSIAQVDAAELERLLAPAIERQQGFLARTLNLGNPPPADPSLGRHAMGTMAIGTLTAGDVTVRGVTSRVEWDEGKLHLLGIAAKLDAGSISGDAAIDLTGAAPGVHFDGTARDLAYRGGGAIDVEGVVDIDGIRPSQWNSARGKGHVAGRSIFFAPDADFRTVSADFAMRGIGPTARWTLSNVEATQGGEVFQGSGTTQADGKLLLELTSKGKQTRYAASIFAAAP
jgi:hypothetical protein